MHSPVLLFVYNRLYTLRKVIDALQKCECAMETELFIISDGPASHQDTNAVQKIRNFLNSIKGFKKINITYRASNFGLARNITCGVEEILSRYNSVIVLEDDIVVNQYFLKFMNNALNMYQTNINVSSVSGFSYLENYDQDEKLGDTYFIKGADCLAWGTWSDRWVSFDGLAKKCLIKLKYEAKIKEFNRKNSYPYFRMLKRASKKANSSWAISWYAVNFLKNRYILFPRCSFACHIGNTKGATNYTYITENDPYLVSLSGVNTKIIEQDVEETSLVTMLYNQFLRDSRGTVFQRAVFKLKKLARLLRLYKS